MKSKKPKAKSPRVALHHRLRAHAQRLRPRKRWHKVLIILTGGVAVCWAVMFGAGTLYQHRHQHESYQVGMSFSVPYAQELGLDWQATYTAMLEELHPSHVRLMSYWNTIEPTPGTYNFENLDWQMDQAAKYGTTVSMAIGERQPRWPECHTPAWANQLTMIEHRQAVLAFTKAVVIRYRNHPALQSWQLENEYFNRSFGKCTDYSRERLQNELQTVHALDKHPVALSFADQLGFPLFGPVPDQYGTSLYTGNYVKLIGYFAYPIPVQFYSAKAQFIEWLHHRKTFIHELQLEPWGPQQTRYMSIAEQDHYMSARHISKNITFARATGMKTIDLWGVEWWYWRKTHFNDSSVWDTIKNVIEQMTIANKQCSQTYGNKATNARSPCP